MKYPLICSLICPIFLASFMVLAACGEVYEEPMPRRDRLHFPIGLAVHPGGNYLYVVNSNFDARYSPEKGGTVSVVDTRNYTILAEKSPFIPSFGGYIKLNDSGDGLKAYVTARRDNTLVAFDVSDSGDELYCTVGKERAHDGMACAITQVPRTSPSAEATPVPDDPFGLDVTTVSRTFGDQEVSVDVIGLAHLSGTSVSALALPDRDLDQASLQSAPLIDGGNVIVRRPGTLEFYVGGRSSNKIVVFAPYINGQGKLEALFSRRTIDLNHVATSVQVRGIAFDEEQDMMYVATQRPDALHIFALAPSDEEQGTGLRHDRVAYIPLADQPSDVVVHSIPGSEKRLIFVPCYDGRSIQVVDPDAAIVKDVIELDARPYQMVIEPQGVRCSTPGTACRGFISLFADSTSIAERCEETTQGCGSVAVLDLDPMSPRYMNVITKIR